MPESRLELTERLIAEGKTTDEIRTILNDLGHADPPPTSGVASPAAELPPPASPSVQAPGAGMAQPEPKTAIAAPRPSRPPLLASLSGAARLPELGWVLIAIFSLVPALVLVIEGIAAGHYATLAQALLALGDVTGVIGLAAYVLNLVLATRLRFLESLFGGLNRVFIAHQVLGGLALIFLLIHPVFTAASYYAYGVHTVAHFFVPQVAYIGSAFGIVALAMIIYLLILSFYARLGYKVWLQTHKYLGLAYLLIILHVLLTPNQITANTAVRWYLYALLIVGLASYVYRTLLPNIFIRRYLYTISAAQPKGIGVVEVTLSPIDKRARIKAGQFIFIAFDSDGLSDEWHPFSVTSSEKSANIMIDIKSLGPYTETLTRLLPHMVGMTARVEGAYGRFSYHNVTNPNQIWIAGGIGITPFLSMVQTLGPDPYNIDLYYSVKTKSELIDLDILALHQSNQPSQVFRAFPFITDDYKTFLSAEIVANNSGDLSRHDFLLCGPPGMMQAIKQQLTKLGVNERQIHSEEFSLN